MEHRKLCEAVEKEVGRTLSAPSDFKWLSAQVEKHTHERLSPSTLMRAWGYMEENVVPRKVTLNIWHVSSDILVMMTLSPISHLAIHQQM